MTAPIPETLQVTSPPASRLRTGRFRRFIARIPRCVIAAAITILIQAAGIAWWKWSGSTLQGYDMFAIASCAALFLPGAIQRLSGLHALVLLGLGMADVALGFAIGYTKVIPSQGYYLHYWINAPMSMILFLGMGEAYLTGHGKWRAAFWIPTAAVGIAGLHQALMNAIGWTGWTRGWNPDYPDSVLYWPILAILAWVGLPLAFAAMKATRLRAIITGGLFAAAVGFHALFFNYLAFDLSERSIQGRGPFTRQNAAILLETRGRPEDFDLILRSLCEADWRNTGSLEPGWYPWQRTALQILLRHDEMTQRTGEALASLLRRKRCRYLAVEIADVMADQKRLEVAPILLRYALEIDDSVWPEKCNKAIEKMGLPEAGLHILIRAVWYDQPKSRPPDFPISADHRRRLTDLLGQDAGPNYSAWVKAVDEAIYNGPSLLPETIQNECDREVAVYIDIMASFNCWYENRVAIGRQRLARSGRTKASQVFQYQWDVTQDMTVEKPDYDAPTIDLFEEEVAAYSARVDAVLDKFFPPSTTQSSPQTPATQTAPASAPSATEAKGP